ncbi:MAG TPA: DUF4010 domain-containing protein [Candidatus Nanoarchaeia archaeon]|nr:DUF4010 domain-containing protein [Candidatus Nanoarchaeia archaeon]
MEESFIILKDVFLALLLGALIGLEREYAQVKRKFKSYGGIRTFPLIALFGVLAAYLGDLVSIWLLIIFSTGFVLLVAFAYMRSRQEQGEWHMGATTELAGLITYLAGILIFYDKITTAATIIVAVTLILYAKTYLHHFTQKLKGTELISTLEFAAIALVILPFLPNKAYGSYGFFNPFLIWLIVVIVSSLSFVGYILEKLWGKKGIEIAGIFGGLVSSTALTSSMAEKSRKSGFSPSFVLGALIANLSMLAKVMLIIFLLDWQLALKAAAPLLILFGSALLIGFPLWKRSRLSKDTFHLESPFHLLSAIRLAALLTAILFLIKFSYGYLSSQGIFLVSFFSGLFNIDVITVSLVQMAGKIGPSAAIKALVLALGATFVVKGGISYVVGGGLFGREMVKYMTILLIVAVVLFFVL